ncbi:hypothetical protein ACVIJW_009672 [Bradyrhizobium barranii subsp. barranii]
MTRLLRGHVRQRRRDAVEHALDVDVDHAVPLIDLQPFEQRLRHQAGIVEHHVDAAVGLHTRVHQGLHLRAVGNVGPDGQRLAATRRDLVHERGKAIGAPRTEHDRGTL